MYAQSCVDKRLAIAERELGFQIDYKTVDEVIEFDARLRKENKYTFDATGTPNGTQNLSAEEAHWILNEQALVQCDSAYFLTRYCFLRDEEGVVMRFRFRVPQRIYFDIICDLEERGAAIEILALKARQLGISIFSELLIAQRSIFSYGVTSVIGSADQSKTSEMSRMLIMCYDMLPVWLRPQYTSRIQSDRGHLLFGHMASGTSFQHGSQKFGIATGSTVTVYHLSEVALYGDRSVELIDEGLWKAVHPSTNVFGVLESTGRSNKGWWADTWYYSKANWPRCRMYPMFLPWYCGTDMYPKPTFLRIRPIPPDWRPNHDTRAHVAKSELFVQSNPLLHKHLLAEQQRRGIAPTRDARWRMPVDQQWWWEIGHEEAKSKGVESSFLQEYAGDDDEALQHSIESVFGHQAMAEIETRRVKKFDCYCLSGQSIESTHEVQPEYFDYTRERIPIRYASRNHGDVYRWELIPLKEERLRFDNPMDVDRILLVFHQPRPGVSYSIGVDTSEGKGQDSTAINVWALGDKGRPDVQVAEYASPYVNHVEAFAFILAIAAYYGKYMEQGVTRWKEPYVSIEQVQAVGDTAQLQMRKMGYSNFHRFVRYDSKRIRKNRANKMGWYTYGWSRALLIGNFVHSAQSGWAEINSPWLIDEMKHFEVHITKSGKEKLEHEEDMHDDRIFSSAEAIFCPHDMDVLAERSKHRAVETASLPQLDLSPYRGNVILASEHRGNTVDSIDDLLYSDRRR
jgi:hypothetical protein